jgi:hypothetical protein
MIAVAFVVLVFGALVAVIWGQKAAQGCFINILKGFGGLVIIGLTAVIPQLMIPLLVMYGVYLIGAYVAQANRAKSEEDDKNKLIARLNVAKAFLDDAMLPIGQSQLNAALANATSKPQRFMPRNRAATVMPGTDSNSEFWSTHVRDAGGSRYVIVESRTNQFIVLSSAQFISDWVPWMAPAIPNVQTSVKPQWQSASD